MLVIIKTNVPLISPQAQLAKADALKAEGNKFFADGNMDDAIVSYYT